MSRRAVFLDKDDTLVPDVPYAAIAEKQILLPGVDEALRILHAAEFLLIVVTNQSGVARGLYPESAVLAVGRQLGELFNKCHVPLTGYYYCPHHPDGNLPGFTVACNCRKPKPGMLYNAAREHSIDLTCSWMVGDKIDDVSAGHAAGCRTIQINGRHALSRRCLCYPMLLHAAKAIVNLMDC